MVTPAPHAPPTGDFDTEPAQRRFVSVDALRGFDMFWIIGGDHLLRSLQKVHDSRMTRALAAQMEHCPLGGVPLL